MSLAGQTQRPVNPHLYGSTCGGSPRVRTDGEIWGHSVPSDAQGIFFWRPLPVAHIKNNILGIKSLKIFFKILQVNLINSFILKLAMIYLKVLSKSGILPKSETLNIPEV